MKYSKRGKRHWRRYAGASYGAPTYGGVYGSSALPSYYGGARPAYTTGSSYTTGATYAAPAGETISAVGA